MKNPFEKEENELKELLELEMQMEALQLENLLSDDDREDLDISEEETEQSFQHLVQKLKNDSIYRPDDRKSDKVIAFGRSRTETTSKSMEEDAAAAGDAPPAKEISEATGETPSTRELTTVSEEIPSGKGLQEVPPDAVQIPISSIPSSPVPEKITKKRFSLGRVAGFVVVVILSVFAGSMTSEANRQYFLKRIQYFGHDNSMIVSGNDEKTDWSQTDEMQANEIIKKELGVEIPVFYYKSELLFDSYHVDKDGGFASIRYLYKENNTKVTLSICDQSKESASLVMSKHGDRTINLEEQDITVFIREISNIDSESEYDALWKYKDTIYSFTGRIAWEEFEKIILGIKFLT